MIARLLYLPSNILSLVVGRLARVRFPRSLSRVLIRAYCRFYRIDLSACSLDLSQFDSLADFFVRDLKPERRPVEGPIVSPVDGVLRDFGPIREGRLSHVKGREYSPGELVQNSEYGRLFSGGFYFNFYLSPADCHHVFSPLAGEIIASSCIPGALFPVNDFALRLVEGLFCINERLVTYIRTERGLVAVVMIGAMCVGQMRVSYDDWNTNATGEIFSWAPGAATNRQGTSLMRVYEKPVQIKAGERLGTFHLGSSVVVLFEKGDLHPANFAAETKVVYGQSLI